MKTHCSKGQCLPGKTSFIVTEVFCFVFLFWILVINCLLYCSQVQVSNQPEHISISDQRSVHPSHSSIVSQKCSETFSKLGPHGLTDEIIRFWWLKVTVGHCRGLWFTSTSDPYLHVTASPFPGTLWLSYELKA